MDGSSFRMDSNSNVPFFGLQFSKTDSVKEEASIVRASNGKLNAVDPIENTEKKSLGNLLGRIKSPRRIPLRRTDLEDQSLSMLK